MGPIKTIMVIDDESVFLDQVKSFLAESEVEIVTVHNSREALEQMELQPVDLLLIDTKMPASSVDAFYLMNTRIQDNTGRIEHFLEKPFTKDQLLTFISKKI